MDDFQQVMYGCMEFLNTKFIMYDWSFSLWEIGLTVAAFHASMNTVAKMFGKQSVEGD